MCSGRMPRSSEGPVQKIQRGWRGQVAPRTLGEDGRETGPHWVRRKGQAPSGETQSTPLPNWAALAPCSVKWKQLCVPTSLRSR